MIFKRKFIIIKIEKNEEKRKGKDSKMTTLIVILLLGFFVLLDSTELKGCVMGCGVIIWAIVIIKMIIGWIFF